MTHKTLPCADASDPQSGNRGWWERNPMTYDWHRTMPFTPGAAEWYREIDRRFLKLAYFAKDGSGAPFGRFLDPAAVSGKPVLEVGCGMGTHAELLARAGARLTTVDLTETALAMTRRRFQIASLSATILRADAERLPFDTGSFEFVWSWGVIHHSSSFDRCLAEITRVLAPGGRLMLMVYYRPSLVYWVHCGLIRGLLMGGLLRKSVDRIYVDSMDGYYARTFNRTELRKLLEPDYRDIRLSIVGQKAELFPIPRCGVKNVLEDLTPDRIADAFLGRWGSMIVAEAVRGGAPPVASYPPAA